MSERLLIIEMRDNLKWARRLIQVLARGIKTCDAIDGTIVRDIDSAILKAEAAISKSSHTTEAQ